MDISNLINLILLLVDAVSQTLGALFSVVFNDIEGFIKGYLALSSLKPINFICKVCGVSSIPIYVLIFLFNKFVKKIKL